MDIRFEKNGIYVDIEVGEDGAVRLWNCCATPRGRTHGAHPLVEVQGTGFDHPYHHGCKHALCGPGCALRYVRHEWTEGTQGCSLAIVQRTEDVQVTTRWHFYEGVRALRAETEVLNVGSDDFPLEYVSSFALTGLGHGADARQGDYQVALPHNAWYGECQWKTHSLQALGYDPVNAISTKRIALSNTGTWACCEALPMGSFLQPGHAMTWQIETSASWCWEIGDMDEELCLRLSGPSWQENQFLRVLHPGEAFVSVPCTVAFGEDFEQSIGEMTKYRRRIRRVNRDNEAPTVVFNDYMNCLCADPTTEKEIPLIDAAAEMGCKYYCIDAGWYADGPWWDGVGEWMPSEKRFPGGIGQLLAYIREKGMVPGLWLELEVMGIHCPMALRVPDDWFFLNQGRRVIDESRYQLDFRNPEVARYADSVVDRLVREYGVGYIKMDYNINAGVGTQHAADSMGDGLLGHARAYLKWLDGVFARYPDLVIENCSSGGMRMEYSLLSRHSIQSVTDQTDYVKLSAIACNAPTACAPEQAAIWSYPLRDADEEAVIFNMVNAMLMRIHQSGQVDGLNEGLRALLKEGIACNQAIAGQIKDGVPFWPLGLASLSDDWHALGMDCGRTAYLAVWHVREGEDAVELPLKGWTKAECIYPAKRGADFACAGGQLRLRLNGVRARLFRLEGKEAADHGHFS